MKVFLGTELDDMYISGQRIKLKRGGRFYRLRKRIEIWWKFRAKKPKGEKE